MLDTLQGFITGTPTWVYILFVVLVVIGFKAAKGGVTPLIKLLVLPVIFGWMAVHTMLSDFPINALNIGYFVVALLITAVMGYIHIARLKCDVDRKHLLVRTEGTWSVLVLVLVIFFSKYYFGYKMSVSPDIIKQVWFAASYIIVNAACIGYLLGKVCAYGVKMRTQDSIDLSGSLS